MITTQMIHKTCEVFNSLKKKKKECRLNFAWRSKINTST